MKITGVKASPGIEIAKALLLEPLKLDFKPKEKYIIDKELTLLESAISDSKSEITKLKEIARKSIGDDLAAIFDAHLLILEDPELMSAIKSKVSDGMCDAATATLEVRNQFVNIFKSMSDAYMKERAADVLDVTNRVIAHLTDQKIVDLAGISEEVIIVAKDLTPSETAQLNKKYVKGFITDVGGRTSHSAIMARNLGLPAVPGTKVATHAIKNGDKLIINGIDGIVTINPTEKELEVAAKNRDLYHQKVAKLKKYKDKESITKDGEKVLVVANIGAVEDIEGAINNGAEGVGLFRTEFLYMGSSDFPTEEEQFQAYKEILEREGDKPVVVRTLDIGGDKKLSYFELPKELNPFLGQRAIRLCLANKLMFKVQLRALLRASIYGNLKIMFPMIATLNEFRSAKAILEECKKELLKEGVKVSDKIEVGIMVEIPAAAVMAEQFAKEVDFFSIGTNDLIQYTMASDRMNESVSYLYQPYSPAILRLVKNTIDAAHKNNIWCGMCGEMAGDVTAIPLLLGLGLDEFSMSTSSILGAREMICNLDKSKVEKIAQKALTLSTTDEVLELLKQL